MNVRFRICSEELKNNYLMINCKASGRNLQWRIFCLYSGICLERLRKVTEIDILIQLIPNMEQKEAWL
jgi:hypothetical protein